MEAILMKAASFIAVIILGYGLRKAGFLCIVKDRA